MSVLYATATTKPHTVHQAATQISEEAGKACCFLDSYKTTLPPQLIVYEERYHYASDLPKLLHIGSEFYTSLQKGRAFASLLAKQGNSDPEC